MPVLSALSSGNTPRTNLPQRANGSGGHDISTAEYNPRDMMLFAKVAECQSISAAARALKRPKASVSRAVARLEDALGVRLVERSSRHLSLTEIGEMFLVHCQRVAEELSEAEATVENMKGTVSGVLRVAVPIVFGRLVLSPILPKFVSAYPQLRCEIKITDRLIDPVEAGFDLVIRASPLEDSALISRLLGEAPYGVFASPEYLAQFPPLTDPGQLADHKLIDLFDGATTKLMEFRRGGVAESVKVNCHVDINDATMRRDIAIQGIGVAVLPSSTCREAVQSGKLVRILSDCELNRVARLYALWPSRRNLLPRLRVFVDFLAEHVPGEMS